MLNFFRLFVVILGGILPTLVEAQVYCRDSDGNMVPITSSNCQSLGISGPVTIPGAITVQGSLTAIQGTSPWVDSITLWGGGTLGAMANYGASPGAVLVPGVNAFITNTPNVALSTQGFKSSFSIIRTNDTNAYTANDVVGAATGSTAAVTLANIGPALGGEVMLTSCRFEIDSTALISGEANYNFYLYNVTPPSALGDNAAFDIPAGDRISYVAKVSFGTPVDEGSTLSIDVDGINKQVTVPNGGSLFAYLVTVGAYTPTASRVYSGICHSTGL